ncbi:MAG: S8/S53 family peptidase [Bacteroidota bacterium]
MTLALLDTGVAPALAHRVADFNEVDRWGRLYRNRRPRDLRRHGTTISHFLLSAAPPGARLCVVATDGRGHNLLALLRAFDFLLGRTDIQLICVALGLPGHRALFAPLIEAGLQRQLFTVAAAGNHGPGQVTTPGACAATLTIGASATGSRPANFSGSRSATAAQAAKPDLLAPGVRVPLPHPDHPTTFHNGSSIATAYVAGRVAHLLQSPGPWDRSRLLRALPEDENIHLPPPLPPGPNPDSEPELPPIDPHLRRRHRYARADQPLSAIVLAHPGRLSALLTRTTETAGTAPSAIKPFVHAPLAEITALPRWFDQLWAQPDHMASSALSANLFDF